MVILCRNGKVWAELINSVEAKNLQSRILKHVKRGTVVCSDTWRGHTGIAARGYLKPNIAAKGAIRKERFHLYLGEYVRRYNHRTFTFKERKKRLLGSYIIMSGPDNQTLSFCKKGWHKDHISDTY